MVITLCIKGALIIAKLIKQHRNRIKVHNDQVNSLLKRSAELDNYVDDFMCISVTDDSTIVLVGGIGVRGSARRSIK